MKLTPQLSVIIVAGSALLFGGCSLTNNPISKVVENNPITNQVSERVTEEMLKDIDDPLVRKNMMATWNKGKMRTRSTVGVGSQKYVSVTEFDMSGGKFNYATAQEKNGKLSQEMIYLGETTYAKDYTDNTWWKETAKPEKKETAADIKEDIPDVINVEEEVAESNKSTFKKIGEEACGTSAPNLTCYVYEETYPENGGKRKFWFDTKEFLTRKEEQGIGNMTTVSEYTYDNIAVKAPSPTKDVPAGKSIYELLGQQQYEQMMEEGGLPQTIPGNTGSSGIEIPNTTEDVPPEPAEDWEMNE